MPATVNGELRAEKATRGEKLVLEKLRANLPKEYTVYVECPLRDKRMERYPEFIILTNYGVIVLEVKDYIHFEKIKPHAAVIRMRNGESRQVPNPVIQAREYAILLNNILKEHIKKDQPNLDKPIPWGYAAVLPNIPNAVKTQLWSPWGENYIWNLDDLSPNIILNKLKYTIDTGHLRPLTSQEIRMVRGVIYPVVYIEQPGRPAVILDPEQEKIVVESVTETLPPPEPSAPIESQSSLLPAREEPLAPPAELEEFTTAEETLAANTSIRLVRGVAGSGKSLVLVQRAKYLASLYPDWKILVLAFNNMLSRDLQSRLHGFRNIKTSSFHSLCMGLLRENIPMPDPGSIQASAEGWLKTVRQNGDQPFPALQEFPDEFLVDEINWIKDLHIQTRAAYLAVPRRGRGDQRKLSPRLRELIYDLVEAYQKSLHDQHTCDWADVASITLDSIREGQIDPPQYNAVLVDEAQDFAPVWLDVIKRCIKEDGLLFMADDPAQSIFRYYSWKERGLPVVGHTRRLHVPYRNTYEIYRAAFSMIEGDEILQKQLEEEGQLVAPDLTSSAMRHGEKPLVTRFDNLDAEAEAIKSRIQSILQEGVPAQQIAVFGRHKEAVARKLRGTGVQICNYREPKGMEFHTVFMTQVQEMFSQDNDDPQRKSVERRLIYMAMTRARNDLFIGYRGRLPGPMENVLPHAVHVGF